MIAQVRYTRSYMPARYQFGAAGSLGFGTPDRTCLRGITIRLHDLTGSEQQMQHTYKLSGRDCRISRVQNSISNMPKVSSWGCRISRARSTISNMSTRYQVGTAGFHGFVTLARTCLRGIRLGLQDLTGPER